MSPQQQTVPGAGTADAEDVRWMRLALDEAKKGRLIAPPNPSVGCVIVRDGREIARGYTHAPGSAHAEIDALENARTAGRPVEGATVYVTLEPCSHFGRTPPCAARLIREKVARVVAATPDPNPLVAGRGIRMLRQAGIEVTVGVCADEAVEANIGFMTRMRTGLPWVRMKIATSLDGRTALSNGRSKWITAEAARRDGRLQRATAQGLLTGIGTVLADDPRMDVRLAGLGDLPSPRKYVLDTNAQTPPVAKILGGRPTVVFCSEAADPQAKAGLAAAGAQVRTLPPGSLPGTLDLRAALESIARDEINVLHVEAGAGLNGALLTAGLVDEIVCYMAPKLMGTGNGWAELPVFASMDEVQCWRFRSAERIGVDVKLVLRKH